MIYPWKCHQSSHQYYQFFLGRPCGQGKPLDLIILQSVQLPLLQQCNTTAMLCHGNSTLAVVVTLVWAKGCVLFGCVHVCIWRGREDRRKEGTETCLLSICWTAVFNQAAGVLYVNGLERGEKPSQIAGIRTHL